MKYTAELEKQEHNDADPPPWLGYGWDGHIAPSPKNTDQSLKKKFFKMKKLCNISAVQGFFSRAWKDHCVICY